jgi:hypothetical protein
MRYLSSILLLILVSFTVKSQSVANDGGVMFLYPNEGAENSSPNVRRGSYANSHILGERVSDLLNSVEREYVYFKKSTGAYPTEEKIVKKKSIYGVIKKLDKYYVSLVSEKPNDLEQIEAEYVLLLDKILRMSKYHTEKVETDLRKIKNASDIIEYLKVKVKFKEES